MTSETNVGAPIWTSQPLDTIPVQPRWSCNAAIATRSVLTFAASLGRRKVLVTELKHPKNGMVPLCQFLSVADLGVVVGVPYVRLLKYGAIPPLRPFWLCDCSFKSPWRLKLHRTGLNIQIGVVFEILASQVVPSRVTTNDYFVSLNFRIRKRLEITDWTVPTDFVLLNRARRKSNPSSAPMVMLCTEVYTP